MTATQKNVFGKPWLSTMTLWIGFAVFYVLAVQVNVTIRLMGAMWVEPPVEEHVKWNPTMVKALTFGHWPAVVDWLWIRALQDPSLSHVPAGTHAPIFYDFDLATDLDPAFPEVFIYGANLLVVVRDDKTGAVELLKKGEHFRREELPNYPKEFYETYWKRGWWVPLTLGYTYLYELNDIVGAADAFSAAAKIPEAPEHLRSLGTRLKTRDGQFDVALNYLDMSIEQSKDERVIEGFEAKKKNLVLSKYIYDLNEDFVDFLQKQPDYRKGLSFNQAQLEKFWKRFQKETNTPRTDPLGGTLSVNDQGRITTTSEREKVFGLE